MKKTYKIEVDCPVCAQKAEQAIAKIEGVESCGVNFMTQKLFINAPREKQEAILDEAIARLKKVDDDIVICC